MRYDSCVFLFKSPTKHKTYVVIHTDDVDCVSERVEDNITIMDKFDDKFGVVICDPHYMLGVNRTFTIDEDGTKYMELTQVDFVETLVKQFNASLPKTANTPAPTGLLLTLAGNSKGVKPSDAECLSVKGLGFQSGTGSLLWASRRCFPECSYGVSQLCRVMSHPSYEALSVMHHMIRYLDSQKHRGIRYTSKVDGTPIVFYDASNKNDPLDSKAQYGWAIFMYGAPIMWSSKKHKHVGVQGTMQNEYMAAGHACRAIAWLRFLLDELELSHLISSPTPMCGDNDAATRLLWNDTITEGNQFFWREYHYGKECYDLGLISPLRVDTSINVADIFTKSLAAPEIKKFLPRLTGYIDEPFVIPPQPIGQHRVTDEIAEDKASFQMLPQPSNLEHGDVAILGGQV